MEQLTVQRHVSDMERDDIYFDFEEAERVVKIIELFRFTKGSFAGKNVELQPYQLFFFMSLFGWKKANGNRRFRRVYKEIARKNGKTEEMGWLGLLMLIFDGEQAAEVYTAATKRDQARICFDAAKIMLKNLRLDSNIIKGQTRIFRHSLTVESTNSTMQPLSSDTKGLDGLNPSCGLVDEYHAHSTSEVLKLIETGMGMRENPILAITTTAGFNKDYPCFQYRTMCENVLRGVLQDDTLFVQIFSMDEGDDWEDVNNWYKANPNLGVSIGLERMKEDYISAKNEGETAIVEFKTKRLNQWVDSASTFISDKLFAENEGEPEYEGRCIVGIDLASTKDITAVVSRFENGSVFCKFYCPEVKINNRDDSDGVDYRQWVKDGYLTATPGNVTDYDWIIEDLVKYDQEYNPQAYIYDPWNSSQFITKLIEKGVNHKKFFKMSQGPSMTNEPIKILEKRFNRIQYQHGNNPVLRWMFRNVRVEVKSNGRKFTKENDKAKIDGAQALMMAEKGFMEFKDDSDKIMAIAF